MGHTGVFNMKGFSHIADDKFRYIVKVAEEFRSLMSMKYTNCSFVLYDIEPMDEGVGIVFCIQKG
jgi:hypothetical protein